MSTNKDVLERIRGRIREAPAPTWRLNQSFALAIGWTTTTEDPENTGHISELTDPEGNPRKDFSIPFYLNDLTAMAKVLKIDFPDHRIAIWSNAGGRGPACTVMIGDEPVHIHESAATMEMALCCAYLSLLIQRIEEGKPLR